MIERTDKDIISFVDGSHRPSVNAAADPTPIDSAVARVLRLLAVASVCVASLAVLVGWVIGSAHIVQIHPKFAPMQFNTALCFLLSALSLGMSRNRPVSTFASLCVLLLAGATLLQYVYEVDFGIDSLFMHHDIVTQTSHPGRMAPNTAIAFVNISFAALFLRRANVVAFVVSLAFALALVALFGYAVHLAPAYGWGALTDMAVHTGVCFVLLSVGWYAELWLNDDGRHFWLPIPVATGTAIVGLLIFQALGYAHVSLVARTSILVGSLLVSAVSTAAVYLALYLNTRHQNLAAEHVQLRHKSQTLQESAEVLERLAAEDPLTRALNRRGVDAILPELRKNAERVDSQLWAMLIDLDEFKRVNDLFGHSRGDEVISESAQRIRDALRLTDRVARIGGDEFLALFLARTPDDAQAVAERLRHAMQTCEVRSESTKLRITASIAMVPCEHSDNVDTLIRKATPLIRRGKLEGRNRVISHLGRTGRNGDDHEWIFDEANYSVSRVRMFELSTSHNVGNQLRVRGNRPGFESREAILKVAYDNQVAHEADLLMLKVCLRTARQRTGTVYVPVRSQTLCDLSPHVLLSMLDGIADRVVFEISEAEVTDQPVRLSEVALFLQKAGAEIALRDVGSGRSTIELLAVLNPRWLVLDRFYVQGVNDDPSKERVMRSLIAIANGLGSELFAEGIHRDEDLAQLRRAGVELGSGTLLDEQAPIKSAAGDAS
ncbi:MAG: diguanylate cyclase [Polyangiales bacterium]